MMDWMKSFVPLIALMVGYLWVSGGINQALFEPNRLKP